mmetsp:Transcript_41/g.181  ORF Transcript_41/g.181 Transcript_41/m.181 type:complete len:414 (-) Transcript_41:225-1466(-)
MASSRLFVASTCFCLEPGSKSRSRFADKHPASVAALCSRALSCFAKFASTALPCEDRAAPSRRSVSPPPRPPAALKLNLRRASLSPAASHRSRSPSASARPSWIVATLTRSCKWAKARTAASSARIEASTFFAKTAAAGTANGTAAGSASASLCVAALACTSEHCTPLVAEQARIAAACSSAQRPRSASSDASTSSSCAMTESSVESRAVASSRCFAVDDRASAATLASALSASTASSAFERAAFSDSSSAAASKAAASAICNASALAAASSAPSSTICRRRPRSAIVLQRPTARARRRSAASAFCLMALSFEVCLSTTPESSSASCEDNTLARAAAARSASTRAAFSATSSKRSCAASPSRGAASRRNFAISAACVAASSERWCCAASRLAPRRWTSSCSCEISRLKPSTLT